MCLYYSDIYTSSHSSENIKSFDIFGICYFCKNLCLQNLIKNLNKYRMKGILDKRTIFIEKVLI